LITLNYTGIKPPAPLSKRWEPHSEANAARNDYIGVVWLDVRQQLLTRAAAAAAAAAAARAVLGQGIQQQQEGAHDRPHQGELPCI
jgi:hypothetical protein